MSSTDQRMQRSILKQMLSLIFFILGCQAIVNRFIQLNNEVIIDLDHFIIAHIEQEPVTYFLAGTDPWCTFRLKFAYDISLTFDMKCEEAHKTFGDILSQANEYHSKKELAKQPIVKSIEDIQPIMNEEQLSILMKKAMQTPEWIEVKRSR